MDFMWAKRESVIHHLEDVYGKECVCHIGTYSQEGVKSGLKDVARVLEIPYKESNDISKQLDRIAAVPPQPKFKDYDVLRDSPVEQERKQWDIFHALEEEYPELFRVARALEGCKRNFGIHASAVLAMPMPVTDVFPTRRDKTTGVTVTLYPGTAVEELGGVKDDILGLKSVDCIVKTLEYIDPALTMNDLYSRMDIRDPNIYEMLAAGESDCVFQLESDMFKGILRQIQPASLDDVAAITALGRPGPISVGFPDAYAKAKNEGINPPVYLRGIENLTKDTYGVFIYQETLMQIARQVSGFSVSQSDSIMRKIIAKKKVDKLEMLRRCLIYGKKNVEGPNGWKDNPTFPWYDPDGKMGPEIPGAIKNGYTEKEMNYFYESIQGYASYA